MKITKTHEFIAAGVLAVVANVALQSPAFKAYIADKGDSMMEKTSTSSVEMVDSKEKINDKISNFRDKWEQAETTNGKAHQVKPK